MSTTTYILKVNGSVSYYPRAWLLEKRLHFPCEEFSDYTKAIRLQRRDKEQITSINDTHHTIDENNS